LIAIGGGWGGGEEPEHKLKNRTARGYFDLGHAFKNEADFGKAIPPLESAIRLKPNYLAAYRDLGDSYAYEGSFADEGSAAQQRLYRKAIAAFESARRLSPRADTSFNLGILYFDTAQYARSIDAIHEGMRLSTTHEDDFIPILEHSEPGDIHFYLGEAYRYLGQTSRAIASYKQVLSAEKTQYADRTRINLGRLYEESGRPELALAVYQQYLESSDEKRHFRTTLADDADVSLKAGLIQANSGKLEESAASFAKAAESAAKWIPEWESRLKTAPDVAAKRRLTALNASLKDTMVQACYNLGVARLALNQPAEAIEALKLALKRAPKHSPSLYNLGLAYHKQGDKPAAGEQLSRLRMLDAELAKELETLLNAER
jgi:tetratricopeptide (TPR) repeat protein